MNLVDIELIEDFVEKAINTYQNEAFAKSYLKRLYERLQRDEPVELREIKVIQMLQERDEWEEPVQATNRIYDLVKSMING